MCTYARSLAGSYIGVVRLLVQIFNNKIMHELNNAWMGTMTLRNYHEIQSESSTHIRHLTDEYIDVDNYLFCY